MTLKEQLMEDLKDAMRSGDELRRDTIRMARTAIKNSEINRMAELDDAGVQDVLRKEIKQRRKSADEYEKGKRMDLADKERAEATFAGGVPAQANECGGDRGRGARGYRAGGVQRNEQSDACGDAEVEGKGRGQGGEPGGHAAAVGVSGEYRGVRG